MEELQVEIREGACRDAILYYVGANASHGLRRSNEDKRKAVMTLLNDPEWVKWSDSAIAKACCVDHKTVAAHRQTILGNSQDTSATGIVERNGKTYEQNTANIGKAKAEIPKLADATQKPNVKAQVGPSLQLSVR